MNELFDAGAEYGDTVRRKLWALLKRQARDYTMGDSGSLPAEVAEELFRSILYTLRLYLNATGETLQALALLDENELFDKAVAHLEGEIERCKALYAAVLRATPEIPHRALADTLQNIGIGLKRYPYRHFAHVPPGEIDYQLCLPVPEDWQGVTYIQEYLRRLMAESLFLRRFDARECARLLAGRFPDYTELLINLYEPVMARVLGRALTQESIEPLNLRRAELSRMPQRFTQGKLQAAARVLCDGMRLTEECRAYVTESALTLLPRLCVASENGTLENIL